MKKWMVAFICFAGLANPAPADVTGIALYRTSGSSAANSNVLDTFAITFGTSASAAGFLLNSLKMWSGTTDTADFSFSSNFTGGNGFTSITSTNTGGINTFDFVNQGFNQNLNPTTTYTLYIRNLNLTTYTTITGSIGAGASPFEFSGETTVDHTTGVTAYYNAFELYATAVPEPGTLLLTGATMAAGALGNWWMRRRKRPS